MKKKVLIIGTGLGGLATGLRLASRGYSVQFVEKAAQPGGRLNQLKKEGFTFDVGPSFFSMPYEFEELVNDCHIEMPFRFIELDPLYTVHLRGSQKSYTLYKDLDRLSQQFETVEPGFKAKFSAYLKQCEALYNDTVDVVIKQNFNSLPAYFKALAQVNPRHLPVLLRSFWRETGHYFQSIEARQIISLIAFFLGRTPFDTNAVYTLLSHIEFSHTGYYNVEGGMYNIVNGLVKALQRFDVSFHYNIEICDYTAQKDQLIAVTDRSGKSWEADLFVVNSDAAWFRGKVFHRKAFSEARLRKMKWTMGYLTLYVGIKCRLPELQHHNYFLGNNFERYAGNLEQNPGTLEKPYYYVNKITEHNPQCAPEGCEALFFVCPVPNLLYKPHWSDKQAITDSILADFSERIGIDIRKELLFEASYSPIDWHNQFNLYQGAGLGLSHHMLQIGAFRPKNYDEQFRNTFYVGASTIPGAGLPMAIISSKLVMERIVR